MKNVNKENRESQDTMGMNSKERRKAMRAHLQANNRTEERTDSVKTDALGMENKGEQRPYQHLTINTGNCGLVDHTQSGWQVKQWADQVQKVAGLLASGGGMAMLAGDVLAVVSSNNGDDGQMAFTLVFGGDMGKQIIGSYCDNPKIGREWLDLFLVEARKLARPFSVAPDPFPQGTDWINQPWLAVTYPRSMMLFFVLNNGRYPLSWTEYEQLIADTWQTMSPGQKQEMRSNAAIRFSQN